MANWREMTDDEYYAAHKELWEWLSEHPEAEKDEWPGWSEYIEPDDHSCCFACAHRWYRELGTCELCLIDWGTYSEYDMNGDLVSMPVTCCQRHTLYSKWDQLEDPVGEEAKDERARLALAIANLPRKKVLDK